MRFYSKPQFIFLAGFFLLFFGLFLILGSGRPKTTDEYMVFFQAESFWDNGNFSVQQAVGIFQHWYGKLGLDGRPYSPYGVLHALLLSPWIGLGRIFFAATGLPVERWILTGPFIPSLFSSWMILLSACLMGRLAFREGIEVKHVFYLLLSFLFSTPLAAYSGTFFSEPLTILIWSLVLTGLVLLKESSKHAFKICFCVGLIAALAGWVRPNQWIYLPIIFLAVCLLSPNRKIISAVIFSIAAFLVIGLLLFSNAKTYGSFFDFGYPDIAESGKKLNEFRTSFGQGLSILLASPGKSFLIYVPASILALFQIQFFKKNLFASFFAGAVLIYLAFFSRFSSVEGGYCFGPRFFLNLIPFAYLALLPCFKNPSPRFFRGFIFTSLIGFLINFPVLGTSFLEAQVDHHYYGAGFTYQTSYVDFWEQWKLFSHYLSLTWQGKGGAIPLGMGWDLGPIFLAKAGVSPSIWKSVLGTAIISMGIGIYLLFADFRASREKASQKGNFQ